jgi:hypothetical protein
VSCARLAAGLKLQRGVGFDFRGQVHPVFLNDRVEDFLNNRCL